MYLTRLIFNSDISYDIAVDIINIPINGISNNETSNILYIYVLYFPQDCYNKQSFVTPYTSVKQIIAILVDKFINNIY